MFYLLSRNITGAAQISYKMQEEKKPWMGRYGFTILAMVVWGVVMYLFELDRECL